MLKCSRFINTISRVSFYYAYITLNLLNKICCTLKKKRKKERSGTVYRLCVVYITLWKGIHFTDDFTYIRKRIRLSKCFQIMVIVVPAIVVCLFSPTMHPLFRSFIQVFGCTIKNEPGTIKYACIVDMNIILKGIKVLYILKDKLINISIRLSIYKGVHD